MKQVLTGFIVAVLMLACSSRDRHDHPAMVTGEQLYNYHCEECHGVDGTGKLFDQTPANILTRRSFNGIVRYITTPVNPDRKMPVFKTMPKAEVAAIARHLQSLRKAYNETSNENKKPRLLLIEP